MGPLVLQESKAIEKSVAALVLRLVVCRLFVCLFVLSFVYSVRRSNEV
jgi:hypothetical protein